MPYVHIDAADVLSEVADADLVAEVVSRRLQERVIAAGIRREHPDQAQEDLARVALADLLGHRHERARAALLRLLAQLVPPSLLAAWEAAEAGRWSDAVCALDRYIEPAPSATATTADLKKLKRAEAPA